MTKESALFAFAGIMILVSVALTHYVHPNWIWFTVFIGANMLQNAFTGFCIPSMVFGKMGLKSKCDKVAE